METFHSLSPRHRARAARALTGAALATLFCAALGPARAQSVTGTGDVTPAVPQPPPPTWTPSLNQLVVGNTGVGTLTVEDGGVVSGPKSVVGYRNGGMGTATVTGAGSIWNVGGNLYIGFEGAGTVTVSAGGQVSAGAVVDIADGAGSSGTLNLNGSDATGRGMLETYSFLEAGGGTATLNLNGGILRTNTDQSDYLRNFGAVIVGSGGAWFDSNGHNITIGPSTTFAGSSTFNKIGTGTLTLTGDSSGFAGFAFVDGGTLAIAQGGKFGSSSSGYIASKTGSVGTVTVSGAGSAWASTGNLHVGDTGNGTLTVSSGGTVSSTGGYIGSGAGSEGHATVTSTDGSGNASTWTTGNLYVGYAGTGTLSVEAGGKVSSLAGIIGFGTGSVGTATVTGAGSTWTSTGDLYVGYSGKGTLTVSEGGKVKASSVGLAFAAGSTGTLNIGAAAGDAAVAAGTLDAATLKFGNRAGTLVFNHTGAIDFATALSSTGSGTHALNHIAGVTTLTGDSSGFTGTTTVSGGTLLVGDAIGAGKLGSAVNVETNGTLGGSGTILGATTIDGTLSAGNSPGTLTFDDNLTLNSGSKSVFELNSPGIVGGTGAGGNDLVVVHGDLTLGGMLDARVAAAGYYRLFNYDGTLSGTLAGGTLTGTGGFTPVSPNNPDVQYGIPGQVNLSVLAAGQTMQFWDGTDTTGNGIVNGGPGTWSTAGTNWTGQPGQAGINGPWGGSVGVFAGNAGGLVTVGGTQSFDTLQFSTNGYTLQGGALAVGVAGGGTLNIDNGISATIASTIQDGVGSALRKTGAGTLILSGTNTYTGGTMLLGGVLSVSTDANLGAASGGLTFDGGTLATTASFDSHRAFTLTQDGRFNVATGTELGLSGAIDGSGALVKQGDGMLTLGGINNYGGGTMLLGGVLSVSADANLGAVSGGLTFDGGTLATTASFDSHRAFTLTQDGRFNVATGTELELSGAIDGSGALVKQGDGMLTLGGINSYGGGTMVEAGVLVGNADSIRGNAAIQTGASLTFDQGIDAIYGGILSGSGSFNKTGVGTLGLAADSSAFTGTTFIQNGTLAVDGKLGGALDVGVAARLQGIGTVGNATVNGTIAPGNGSVGTIGVANITFNAGSVYEAGVNAAGQSDKIAASGTATINGGGVKVLAGSGDYAPQTQYTILTAAGGRTGLFTDGVTSNFAFLDPSLSYDASSIYLTMTRNDISFAGIGQTANQIATAGGVESLGLGNPVYNAVLNLSAPQARYAFDQLSGEFHASAKTALIEDSRFIRNAVNDRIRAAFDGVGASSMPVMAYGEGGPQFVPATTDRFAVWGQGFGSWGNTDGDGNAARLNRSTSGFFFGADAPVFDASRFGPWRFGALAGYSRTTFDVKDRRSSGWSDNYHVGLYGGTTWGALALRTGASYTWHDISTSRGVSFHGFSDSLKGDYNAATAQVFGELDYDIRTGNLAFEPFANLAYVNLHTDGFTEKGGAAALSGQSATTDATFTTLGLRASSTFDLNGASLTAKGTFGWRHGFGDVTPFSAMRFTGGGRLHPHRGSDRARLGGSRSRPRLCALVHRYPRRHLWQPVRLGRNRPVLPGEFQRQVLRGTLHGRNIPNGPPIVWLRRIQFRAQLREI